MQVQEYKQRSWQHESLSKCASYKNTDRSYNNAHTMVATCVESLIALQILRLLRCFKFIKTQGFVNHWTIKLQQWPHTKKSKFLGKST